MASRARTFSDPDWRTGYCVEPAIAEVGRATGRDIWSELGKPPRSWKEAAELYRRLGVRNLSEAVTKILGEPIPCRRAMRGDIMMVDGALGICRGEWIECMDRMQPRKRATLAWSAKGNPPRPA